MGDVFIRARGASFGDVSETLHAHIKVWLDHVIGKASEVSYLYPNHG